MHTTLEREKLMQELSDSEFNQKSIGYGYRIWYKALYRQGKISGQWIQQ